MRDATIMTVTTMLSIGLILCFAFSCTAQTSYPRSSTPLYEEEDVRIPLSHIYSLEMPGTLQLGQNYQIRQSLKPVAGKSFIVPGVGETALKKAAAGLSHPNESRRSYKQGEDASVVFYASQNAVYVHIVKVLRTVDSIKIFYLVVPHETRDLTSHFALIPVTDLRAGRYQIELIQVPFHHPNLPGGKVEKEISTVCRPSKFVVLANSSNTQKADQ